MPLLKEGVFSVFSLLAAIFKTITKAIEKTKEPAHFRIINLTPNINGSTMQPVCYCSPLLQRNLNFGKAANPDRVHGCCDFGQLLPYKAPPELGQNYDRDLAFRVAQPRFRASVTEWLARARTSPRGALLSSRICTF